jgi:hypothetical protein
LGASALFSSLGMHAHMQPLRRAPHRGGSRAAAVTYVTASTSSYCGGLPLLITLRTENSKLNLLIEKSAKKIKWVNCYAMDKAKAKVNQSCYCWQNCCSDLIYYDSLKCQCLAPLSYLCISNLKSSGEDTKLLLEFQLTWHACSYAASQTSSTPWRITRSSCNVHYSLNFFRYY